MNSNEDEIISVVITTVDNDNDLLAEHVADGNMNRGMTSFQEVSISLPSQPDIPCGESKSGTSFPDNINNLSVKKSFLLPRSWSFINRGRSLPKIASNSSSRRQSTRSAFSVASNEFDSTEQEISPSRKMLSSPCLSKRMSLTPSQLNLAAIGRPFSQLKKAISSATKHQKRHNTTYEPQDSDSRIIGGDNSKKTKFQRKIDRWANTLQAAIQEDINGNTMEACDAYKNFNSQVVKEVIASFEQFTCDQQKLLNRLMTAVDKRCSKLHCQLNSNVELDQENGNSDPTLSDLRQCFGLLSTIKAIGSNKTMPVVLVYQEKVHRKKHRDEQKGKSNKVVFPKEKREFLLQMGLHQSMVTHLGFDFSVMPQPENEKLPSTTFELGSKDNSQDSFVTVSQFAGTDRPPEVVAVSPPNNIYRNDLDISITPVKDSGKMSLIDHCLGMRKKSSSNPTQTGLTDFENNYKPVNTMSVEEWIDEEISRTTRKHSVSMLSCDSCSSSESIDSDYEMETDTAVLANYRHRDSLLPPPFHEAIGTYLVLAFEKIGLKRSNIVSPFLRVSLRDNLGSLIGEAQETRCWEVINRNYLRAPSPVFLQQSLEALPEDFSIFFEVRHLFPTKRKVSTHSYTFIERSEIQNGEFVCEMYKPPVDFSKTSFTPYSEKALFLHLEIRSEREEELVG